MARRSKNIFLLFLVFLILFFANLTIKPRKCSRNLNETCLAATNSRDWIQSKFDASMIRPKNSKLLTDWIKNRTGLILKHKKDSTWVDFEFYEKASTIDQLVSSRKTLSKWSLWRSEVFLWNNLEKGRLYVRDLVDLDGIVSDRYDFVCAEEVLEHIANPLKALLEWLRILRRGGLIMIIVPSKNSTFDRRRDSIGLDHLIDDFRRKISESDLTHLPEILNQFDQKENLSNFQVLSKQNGKHRIIHHHVYHQELLYEMFRCLDLEILLQSNWDDRELIVGQKRSVL